MKKAFLTPTLLILVSLPLYSQVTQDSLKLDWGATVN